MDTTGSCTSSNTLVARLSLEIAISIRNFHLDDFLTSHNLKEDTVNVESINATALSSTSITLVCPLPTALQLEKKYQTSSKKYLNHGASTTVHIKCLGLLRGQHNQAAITSKGKPQPYRTNSPTKSQTVSFSSSSASTFLIRSTEGKREMGKVLNILGDAILDIFQEYRKATKQEKIARTQTRQGPSRRRPSTDDSARRYSMSLQQSPSRSSSKDVPCCSECGGVILPPDEARNGDEEKLPYEDDEKERNAYHSRIAASAKCEEIKKEKREDWGSKTKLRRGSSSASDVKRLPESRSDRRFSSSSSKGTPVASAKESKSTMKSKSDYQAASSAAFSSILPLCSCPPPRKEKGGVEDFDDLAYDMGRRLMLPTRMCFANLSSIVEGATALEKLHRHHSLVFNISHSWHTLALALAHLQSTGQVSLTLRAANIVRQVAMPSRAQVRVAETTRTIRAMRLWNSLVSRAILAQERSTLLFSHFCAACVVLLQDFLVKSTDPIGDAVRSFLASQPSPSERRCLSDDIKDMLRLTGDDEEEVKVGGKTKGWGKTVGSLNPPTKKAQGIENGHVVGKFTPTNPPQRASIETPGNEITRTTVAEAFQRHKFGGEGPTAKIKLRGLAMVLREIGQMDIYPTDVWDWTMKRKEVNLKVASSPTKSVVLASSAWLLTLEELFDFLEAHSLIVSKANVTKTKDPSKPSSSPKHLSGANPRGDHPAPASILPAAPASVEKRAEKGEKKLVTSSGGQETIASKGEVASASTKALQSASSTVPEINKPLETLAEVPLSTQAPCVNPPSPASIDKAMSPSLVNRHDANKASSLEPTTQEPLSLEKQSVVEQIRQYPPPTQHQQSNATPDDAISSTREPSIAAASSVASPPLHPPASLVPTDTTATKPAAPVSAGNDTPSSPAISSIVEKEFSTTTSSASQKPPLPFSAQMTPVTTPANPISKADIVPEKGVAKDAVTGAANAAEPQPQGSQEQEIGPSKKGHATAETTKASASEERSISVEKEKEQERQPAEGSKAGGQVDKGQEKESVKPKLTLSSVPQSQLQKGLKRSSSSGGGGGGGSQFELALAASKGAAGGGTTITTAPRRSSLSESNSESRGGKTSSSSSSIRESLNRDRPPLQAKAESKGEGIDKNDWRTDSISKK